MPPKPIASGPSVPNQFFAWSADVTDEADKFDDDSDVWKVEEGVIVIGIAFDTGVATLTGPYTRDTTVIDLEGVQGDATWTLTIEKN